MLDRKVVRSPLWRRVGFEALAVVLLMPVKVTMFVGAIYVPHGFVQVYDCTTSTPNTICESLFSPWRREWSPP